MQRGWRQPRSDVLRPLDGEAKRRRQKILEHERIELIGAAEYSGEMRANHMRVYKVQPLASNP